MIKLVKSDVIIVQNKSFEFIRRLPDGCFQAEVVETGERITLKDDDLARLIGKGEASIQYAGMTINSPVIAESKDYSSLPKKVKDKAERSLTYLKELVQLGFTKYIRAEVLVELKRIAIEKFGPKENPPSYPTICRWRKKTGGKLDKKKLVDKNHLKGVKKEGSDKRKLDVEVTEIISNHIYSNYMKSPPISIESTYSLICNEINENNELRDSNDKLKSPSYWSVREAILRVDEYDRVASRYGKEAADARFRAVGVGPRPTKPLELVQVDHTKLDLFVIDSDTFLPLGRPTLVTNHDVFSKMPTGVHISFDPPSLQTFTQCLKNAVLPKDYVKELRLSPDIKVQYPPIHHTWDCYGIGEEYSLDQALEDVGVNLSDIAVSLGFNYRILPRKSPGFKGSQERFYKTLNIQLLHETPGTTFSNFLDLGDYDPVKNAIITSNDLLYIAHKYILDIYSQKIHRGIENIPANVWAKGVAEHPVRMVESLEDLDAYLGNVDYRVLTRKGVEYDHLHFCSDVVVLWLRDREFQRRSEKTKGGYTVKIKSDSTDLSRFWIFDPRIEKYIRVPCNEREYASGLSRWQHKVIRRYAQDTLNLELDLAGLNKAKAEIVEIVKVIISSRKKSRRVSSAQWAARMKGVGKNAPAGKIIPEQPRLLTNEPAVGANPAPDSLSPSKGDSDRPSRTRAGDGALFKAEPSDSVDLYDE